MIFAWCQECLIEWHGYSLTSFASEFESPAKPLERFVQFFADAGGHLIDDIHIEIEIHAAIGKQILEIRLLQNVRYARQ